MYAVFMRLIVFIADRKNIYNCRLYYVTNINLIKSKYF